MKSNNLTVVIVNDFDYIQGGASKVAIDTAKLLYDNDINVIFFSATHKENDYKFKQICTNQNECLKDGIRGAFRGLYNIKAAKEFKKLLKTLDRNNTIIHVHGWTKSLSSSIFRIAKKQKFKIALTLHDYFTVCPNGGFFNYKKCEICKKKAMSFDCIKTNCDSRNYLFKIYRCIRQTIQNLNTKNLKNIDYFISISDFSVDKLKSYFYKNINIRKITNPISVNSNDRVEAEKNSSYLYVGRVSKEKGVDIFCRAISKLKLPAIVVGDGSELGHLKKEYPKIKFVGWKSNNEVLEYMKQARCLVFPSLWYETAGLTAIEASLLGIPVITSNSTAATDYIKDNYDGLYFKTGDTKDLINKIKATKDDKIVELLSTNAYSKTINKTYSFSIYYEQLKKLYNDILGAE